MLFFLSSALTLLSAALLSNAGLGTPERELHEKYKEPVSISFLNETTSMFTKHIQYPDDQYTDVFFVCPLS
jgi:hypothetical protein